MVDQDDRTLKTGTVPADSQLRMGRKKGEAILQAELVGTIPGGLGDGGMVCGSLTKCHG